MSGNAFKESLPSNSHLLVLLFWLSVDMSYCSIIKAAQPKQLTGASTFSFSDLWDMLPEISGPTALAVQLSVVSSSICAEDGSSTVLTLSLLSLIKDPDYLLCNIQLESLPVGLVSVSSPLSEVAVVLCLNSSFPY
jgi:hypothetical protein